MSYTCEITLDTLEKSSVVHDLEKGWAITRGAVITGLNPSHNLTGPALAAAIRRLDTRS